MENRRKNVNDDDDKEFSLMVYTLRCHRSDPSFIPRQGYVYGKSIMLDHKQSWSLFDNYIFYNYIIH